MKLVALELVNFRAFEKLHIQFPEKEGGLTVLLGINGSGKTSILEGIATALRPLQGIFAGNQHQTGQFNKEQVRTHVHSLGSKITFEKEQVYKYTAHLTVNGKNISWFYTNNGGNLQEITDYGNQLVRQVVNGARIELPLFVFYSIKRYWSANIGKIDPLPLGSRLDPYKDCLDPKPELETLYEWFKRMHLILLEDGDVPEELAAVRNIFSDFLSVLLESKDSVKIRYSVKHDELLLQLHKNQDWQPFTMLSDGYRNLLGMVGDIAFRCAELNPHNVQKTSGLVLIDEPELHLHPKWQRNLIPALRKAFPNVQFVLATHSPLILGDVRKENVLVLEGYKIVNKSSPYGKDPNSVLSEIFDLKKYPPEMQREFDKLYRLMDDPAHIKETESLLRELEETYGYYHEEVVRARAHFNTLNTV